MLFGVVLAAVVAGVVLATGGGPAVLDSRPTPTERAAAITVETEWAVTDRPIRGLPVDLTLVFARTEAVVGTIADPPWSVNVVNAEQIASIGADGERDARVERFETLLGMDSEPATRLVGLVQSPREVLVAAETVDDPEQLRGLLVHEYVHVIQFRQGAFGTFADHETDTRDERLVRTAMIEGAAVYVSTTYAERYDRNFTTWASPEQVGFHRNATGPTRLSTTPYVVGYRYLSRRLDSPREIPRLYERPPETTEELLHGRPPGSTDPTAVSVSVRRESRWNASSDTRTGEAFLQAALSTELSVSRAKRAARGWDGDERQTLVRGDRTAFVWAIHFDDARNATVFADAFETFLDRRAERDGNVWRAESAAYRVVQPSDRLVVVVLGDPTFVRENRLSADDTGVVVGSRSESRVGPERVTAAGAGQAGSGGGDRAAPLVTRSD